MVQVHKNFTAHLPTGKDYKQLHLNHLRRFLTIGCKGLSKKEGPYSGNLKSHSPMSL